EGNLEFVPTAELDLVFHGNVKTEDCGPGFLGEQDRTLLGHITRASWTIDGKRGIAPIADIADHFRQCTKSAAGTGTAGGAVTESFDALRDGFAVQIQTSHDNNAAMAPIKCRRKDASVPKSEYRAMSGLVDGVEMFAADRLPPHRAADRANRNGA